MTKQQLLASADSMELSQWQAFFPVRSRVLEDHRKRAREDAALMGDDG